MYGGIPGAPAVTTDPQEGLHYRLSVLYKSTKENFHTLRGLQIKLVIYRRSDKPRGTAIVAIEEKRDSRGDPAGDLIEETQKVIQYTRRPKKEIRIEYLSLLLQKETTRVSSSVPEVKEIKGPNMFYWGVSIW